MLLAILSNPLIKDAYPLVTRPMAQVIRELPGKRNYNDKKDEARRRQSQLINSRFIDDKFKPYVSPSGKVTIFIDPASLKLLRGCLTLRGKTNEDIIATILAAIEESVKECFERDRCPIPKGGINIIFYPHNRVRFGDSDDEFSENPTIRDYLPPRVDGVVVNPELILINLEQVGKTDAGHYLCDIIPHELEHSIQLIIGGKLGFSLTTMPIAIREGMAVKNESLETQCLHLTRAQELMDKRLSEYILDLLTEKDLKIKKRRPYPYAQYFALVLYLESEKKYPDSFERLMRDWEAYQKAPEPKRRELSQMLILLQKYFKDYNEIDWKKFVDEAVKRCQQKLIIYQRIDY